MDDIFGIIIAVGICYLGYRAFFGASPRARHVISDSVVDQVYGMFPHLSRSAIRNELEITGDVQRTVEKCLSGILREPAVIPDSLPRPHTPAPQSSSSPSSFIPPPSISLIKRFELETRLTDEIVDQEGKREKVPWETTAEGREKSLKDRKALMILKARRKLV